VRTASLVGRDLRNGRNGLSTVASVAPWLGLCGVILGIDNSFPAFGADRNTILAAIIDRLSQALFPCALAFAVALAALWFRQFLLAEIETLESDMENVSLDLVNTLSRL
jgi:biopolymer transport protein ExbB/TolQ